MSIVPQITCSRKRRDKLNNLRNTFTFIANLTILGSASILFACVKDSEKDFNYLAYVTFAFGISTSIYFIVAINEVKLSHDSQKFANALKQELEKQKIFEANS